MSNCDKCTGLASGDERNGKSHAAIAEKANIPEVGDTVYASMTGYPVYHGVIEKIIDLFCPFGIRCDDGELRYFMLVERDLEARK